MVGVVADLFGTLICAVPAGFAEPEAWWRLLRDIDSNQTALRCQPRSGGSRLRPGTLRYTPRPMTRFSRKRLRPAPGQLTLGFEEDPVAIRMAVEDLARAAEPSARLIPELGVRCGAGRIDLAAAGSELVGWEIKSARDNLVRLPAQVEIFGQIFGRLTLVAPERHLASARSWVPDWWGLMSVRGGELRVERVARLNARRDAMALAELLWKEEAVAIATRRLGRRPTGPRRVVWQQLADSMSPDELAAIVCAQLKQRTGWRLAA